MQVGYQDYVVNVVRAAAILTNSYVAGTVLGLKTATLNNSAPADLCVENYNQLNLEISFTKGSLTSGEVKVEFSDDNTTYYQETFQNISGGASTDTAGYHTFGATGNYFLSLPIRARYIKISANGTGTVTDSSMAIKAILGVV